MLVLTRKQNEKIRIGENITITVIRMKGKAVRLGIEAPRSVNVLRGELVFSSESDEADIHCEPSKGAERVDESAADTIIEKRVPRTRLGSLSLSSKS